MITFDDNARSGAFGGQTGPSLNRTYKAKDPLRWALEGGGCREDRLPCLRRTRRRARHAGRSA